MTTVGRSYSLSLMRGLTAQEVGALKKAGIDNTGELLAATGSTYKEQKLARATGISMDRMREAVNRADLMQVAGMGAARADLFEHAGINSARELAQRNPESLAKLMTEFIRSHPELNHRLPSPTTVASLVEKAKALQTPATDGVQTLDEAKQAAAAALHDHIDNVLFSNHPEGQSFRDAILSWRPSTEWPKVQSDMHRDVELFLNHPLQGGERVGYEGQDDEGDRFALWGRLYSLYTQVVVNKATGKADPVYIEID